MAEPSSPIGRTLSHYRIEEELGHGGMGVVYRALDVRLGRSVALKVLPPEAAHDPGRRQRFEREARAAAALSHPGIAAVYELGEDGELFIVYEYIAGQTLRVLQRPRLPLPELLEVATDIAEALAAAHARGVVHRDLKPENVMRTADGLIKILDFGLARLQSGPLESSTRATGPLESATETHMTHPGMVVGTVAYMSPEQLEGGEVDFRSDLFSFGVMLYELASGSHPFQGASHASTISNIMTAEPAPLLQRNPLSPPELDRIVRKCLRKRRQERYQSTRDLAVDLRTLKRESGEQPSSTVAPAPVASEDRRLSRIRLSWNILQVLAILVSTPLWIYLAWWGSSEAGVSWAKPAFIAVCVGAGINAASRGTFLSFALLGIPDFPSFLRRNFFWQRLSIWLVAPALAAFAVPLAEAHPGLAATLAAIALVALIGSEIVEPAFLRATFPQAFGGAAETAKPKRESAKPLVWWWAEVLFVTSAYLFTPFFAWWVRNNATDWWQTGPNNVAFAALLVCVMVPLSLRVIAMETAFFTPQELAERVRRFAPAIRFFTYSHAALVAVMGLELTLGRYPLLVPVLWMMAAGIIAWGLVFEPIVERAAFPPAAEAASRSAGPQAAAPGKSGQ